VDGGRSNCGRGGGYARWVRDGGGGGGVESDDTLPDMFATPPARAINPRRGGKRGEVHTPTQPQPAGAGTGETVQADEGIPQEPENQRG
jgi:hypothetical protein